MSDDDKMNYTVENTGWTPELRAEFIRRRRGRNWALFGVLVGLCALIYAIAVVKLLHTGKMW